MTANDALDKYLSSLSPRERIAKSRDIRDACRISRFVLCFWRSGRTPIPWYFLPKITETIGQNIFENIEK